MRNQLAGLLIAASVSWLPVQDPAQPPPQDQRSGQDQGDQGPGRPSRPDDDGPGEPPPPPPFGPPPNPLFISIDLDGDGELSSKEVARAAQSIAKLDKNKDGVITEDEVRPPRPPGGRRSRFGGPPGQDGPPGPGSRPGAAGRAGVVDARALVDSVMRFDKDGDGKVSAKELPERMARMLEAGDINKDGALQRSEVETLSRRPSPRRPGAPVGGLSGPPPGAPGSQDNR